MQAVLEFDVEDPQSVLDAIGLEKIPKTTIEIEKKDKKIIIKIESSDISAFSAAVNAYIRAMKVVYGIDAQL